MSTATAEVHIDLSVKQIAEFCKVSPRTVNLWRSAAEDRLGRKLGSKVGKTWTFAGEEIREILKSREHDPSEHSGNQGTSQNFRETSPFSNQNTQAEGDVLGGMDSLVASGDANAIAVGQALGQRWNQMLLTSALQTMQSGMMQMQTQFDEMHTAIAVPLNTAPQLPGTNPQQAQLEGNYE
jgi:hypothetical protein